MNTRSRFTVKKALLGIGAVVLSPVIAVTLTNAAPHVSELMTGAGRLMNISEQSKIKALNNGNCILYQPTENGVATSVIENFQPPAETTTAAVTEETAPPQTTAPILISQNISDEREDLSVFSNISGSIVKTTYKPNAGENFLNLKDGGQVRNCTDLSNEFVQAEMEKTPDFSISLDGTPQVLIMHTHTSESYEIKEKDYYDEEYTCRSADPENSVVAVGTAIAEQLAAAGIAVIHDGTVHDSTYTGAYERSEATVKSILEKYPSIKVVLDIHRDAIEEFDGSHVAAVTEINGKEAAQIMIISAADDGTYGIPNYLENFHFACALQNKIESDYSGLTRPVLFQYCQYNQHLTTGSLLIEVGSHGNTVEQAVYTGELIGKSIAEQLLAMAE
ncbi:MAG: stage II sporulation protein P [Ruminiclostridium sp.]